MGLSFPFPFLDVLRLPTDAAPGDSQIVLDGVNGTIEVYDGSTLLIRINELGLRVLPDNPDSTNDSSLILDATGNDAQLSFKSSRGGAGINDATIQDFAFGNYDQALLMAVRQTEDDAATFIIAADPSLAPTFRFRNERTGSPLDVLRIDGDDSVLGGGTTAARIVTNLGDGNIELGRGVLPNKLNLLTNDSARAAGVTTDMSIANDFFAERSYEVVFRSQFNAGTAGAVYAANLLEDGVLYARCGRENLEAGDTAGFFSTTVLYQPTTDGSHTLAIQNDAGSGGTMQLAGAGLRRQLYVKDIGI